MRTRRTVLALPLVALASAVTLAACGGTSQADMKAEYKKNVTAVLDQTRRSFQNLQTSLSGKSGPQVLSAVQQQLVSTADRINRLDPPDNLKPENQKLVAELHQFASDFESVK